MISPIIMTPATTLILTAITIVSVHQYTVTRIRCYANVKDTVT